VVFDTTKNGGVINAGFSAVEWGGAEKPKK
jgi:hypothetical protein